MKIIERNVKPRDSDLKVIVKDVSGRIVDAQTLSGRMANER